MTVKPKTSLTFDFGNLLPSSVESQPGSYLASDLHKLEHFQRSKARGQLCGKNTVMTRLSEDHGNTTSVSASIARRLGEERRLERHPAAARQPD